MSSLQVRDLPDPLYRKLIQQAEKEHRSLTQQAIATLSKGLGISDDAMERRRKVLDENREFPIKVSGKGIKNPADLLREDRDR